MKAPEMIVKLTREELKLLLKLASDQLFREEFINPKMPGFRSNKESLEQAKSLIARLQAAAIADAQSEGAREKTASPRTRNAVTAR